MTLFYFQLGSQKAIAFKQPDKPEETLEDLPDDFYELSIEEVRRLYRDLQVKRSELENTPLLTTEKREAQNKDVSTTNSLFKHPLDFTSCHGEQCTRSVVTLWGIQFGIKLL